MHTLADLLSVLLGTALVAAGATRVARAAGLRGWIDLGVAVPVLAAAQIIATLVFAGVLLERLTYVTVLVTTVVVSGALLVFVRPAGRARRPSLRSLTAFARANPLVAALAVVAVAAMAWRVVVALVIPPYGYDPLHYHLPTVIDWIQSHRIHASQLNTCCAYYPENGELLATWPGLLGGGVEYVDLVQIAAALVGAVAVAGIARAARLPREGMVAAASLFLLTPVLLAQANTADVDVSFSATAVAAYYLVIRALEETGRQRWFLFGAAGIAAGLCVGIKPTGSEFLVALAVPLVVGAVVVRKRRPWRETGLAAALLAVPVALLGFTWYLRSWIVTGSPYHPMEVKLGGVTVFAGTNHLAGPPASLGRYPKILQPFISWASDLHFWTKPGYTLGGLTTGGLGPVWAYFGVVSVLVFAVYAWRRCRPVFWFFLVPTGLLLAAQPDNWYSRYTIGIAAGGAIAVAWAITGSWRPARLRLALGVATLFLAAAGGWIATRLIIPTAGFSNVGLGAVVRNALHGHHTVGSVFGAGYGWIDQIHGQPVAVDPNADHMFSPLAGRRFENRLVPLPPRANLRTWVMTHDVAYVATFRGTHYDSYYDKQARADPQLFQPIGGKRLLGYRVVRP